MFSVPTHQLFSPLFYVAQVDFGSSSLLRSNLEKYSSVFLNVCIFLCVYMGGFKPSGFNTGILMLICLFVLFLAGYESQNLR